MTPLRSMTGFAHATEGDVSVSVKTVNHRGLDVHIRGPEVVDAYESGIRSLIKGHIARGHVDVRITIGGGAQTVVTRGPFLNHALLDAYLKAFEEASSKLGLYVKPDLNAVFQVHGMFTANQQPILLDGTEAALLKTLAHALDELNVFRAREGAEIAEEMRGHNAEIAAATQAMEEIREGALAALQKRSAERLKDLLQGAQVDPQRLAQEVAILVDRSDLSEELARLRIHAAQLAGLLDQGGEVGKRLDFLLQEMHRETNTILSKSGGVGEAGLRITELALNAKAAIEKIREQSLNLE